MSGQRTRSSEGTQGDAFTEAGSLQLKSLHYLDQLLPMLLNFVFFRILHIFNVLQDAMYVPSPRLDTDSVGPANFKVRNGSSVALANIKQPVEDVVVILSVYNDFVCAIEDGGGFGIYEAAGAEERCICRCSPGRVAAVNKTFLA